MIKSRLKSGFLVEESFVKRSNLFYGIALVIPVIVLVAAELILRIVNYRPTEPLFIDAPSMTSYMQPNENVINRFFASPEMAPKVSPDTQYFLKAKPEGSFRIVVQGGSTAAGFPYGRWGSLSGMLQQRFKRLYPEKNIEIINTAMSSVNSFTLLDFVEEIIELKPDLILVYAGHNEYLGIMGVGSSFSSRSNYSAKLLFLKLKDFKLYRLVESIYYAMIGKTQRLNGDQTTESDQRSLMAKIAKDKDIEFGSELYLSGVEQFKNNMTLILEKYQQNRIPVIVGNLVSNEKDLPPFSALSDNNSNAAVYYNKGMNALQHKRYQQSRSYFSEARDHDSLRFRAPSEFNRVIDALISEELAYFADVDERIRQDSDDKLIGKKHMLEHLHPTVRGYFLLADAYLNAMLKYQLLPTLKNQDLNSNFAWSEQPITKADELYGEFKITRLTSDYPFKAAPEKVIIPINNTLEHQALNWREQGKSWLQINQQLLVEYQKRNDFPESAKIAGLLADALPNQFDSTFAAGMLYKKIDNLPLSTHHLLRAIELKPNEINGRLSLAQNYFLLKEFDKSLKLLKQVKTIQPTHPQVDKLMLMVEQAR